MTRNKREDSARPQRDCPSLESSSVLSLLSSMSLLFAAMLLMLLPLLLQVILQVLHARRTSTMNMEHAIATEATSALPAPATTE